MATFLDITLLEKFSIIFPFLLVFVVVFGTLSYSKILGNNKALQSFFALILAFFTFFSPTIRIIINRMAPWFVLLFIAILFIIMAFKAYGATDADITNLLHSKRYGSQIVWWILVLAIIIVIGSITLRGGEKGIRPTSMNITTSEGTTTTTDVTKEKSVFWDTLLHPKVLGLVAILLIANFTISNLASGGFPKS
jgi:hypothetical protein